MAKNYAKHVSTKVTPQSEPIPGSAQQQNNAGGFSFVLGDWGHLDRFLILGADGGTYYASERKLTKDNAACVRRCLKADGQRTVERIVEISESGRAPKNDPALFALALAAAYEVKDGSPKAVATRQMALAALPSVARTGTMLFQFNAMAEQLRGRGRALNNAVANWYTEQPLERVVYQLVKYQQRDGWSHRDLLRLTKPKTDDAARSLAFRWAVGKLDANTTPLEEAAHGHILAFEAAKGATDAKQICALINKFDMPREAIPTQWLKSPEVWEALLERMPMTAMIRNLASMTACGLLAPLSDAVKKVKDELSNADRLRKSRIHPIAMLSALLTYKQGHGVKGKLTWTPVPQLVDALDAGFYKCFANIEPTGKRWFLGCDVSGSMYGSMIAGVPGLTAGMGSAAMALVTANTEQNWHLAVFNTGMVPCDITPSMRLDQVSEKMSRMPWGGTDCAQPMIYATDRKLKVDAFTVYTDNETYANPHIHPTQALDQYQQKMGIGAKLIVVGMTATEFSIADGARTDMLDVVGFSADAPAVMADFVR